MVSINYSAREVCCKIVYYGPGLSGKTTNLQYIHSKVPQDTRGKLISLATEADRTLYFDFLPINIGTINGFQAKFQLYTVPGQVYYNATRKLVLRGVDGVVFVADSQPDKMDENIESLANLMENLEEYGYRPEDLPIVIQLNKRDLPNVLPVDQLNAQLNPHNLPTFEASATVGNGVFDTLKLIIRLVLEKAKATSAPKTTASAQPTVTAVPRPQPAPYPEPAPAPQPVAAGVAAAAPRPIAPAPAADTAYRPYPGSGTQPVKQQAPAAQAPSPQPPAPAQPVAAEVAPSPVAPPTQPAEIKTDEQPVAAESNAQSPQMAPSLRRRGEPKKRGFFKRLFGIK